MWDTLLWIVYKESKIAHATFIISNLVLFHIWETQRLNSSNLKKNKVSKIAIHINILQFCICGVESYSSALIEQEGKKTKDRRSKRETKRYGEATEVQKHQSTGLSSKEFFKRVMKCKGFQPAFIFLNKAD